MNESVAVYHRIFVRVIKRAVFYQLRDERRFAGEAARRYDERPPAPADNPCVQKQPPAREFGDRQTNLAFDDVYEIIFAARGRQNFVVPLDLVFAPFVELYLKQSFGFVRRDVFKAGRQNSTEPRPYAVEVNQPLRTYRDADAVCPYIDLIVDYIF